MNYGYVELANEKPLFDCEIHYDAFGINVSVRHKLVDFSSFPPNAKLY